MKKYAILTMAMVLALALCACGGTAETTAAPATEAPTTEVPTTVPPTTVHTHSYTQTVTEADCVNGGYTTNTCACGDSYRSDEKEAMGHSLTDATCDKAKTCTVCAATEGEALGHSWAEGKCTVCGEEQPNYKPLNTGKWQALVMRGDGVLCNIELCVQDGQQVFECGYGAELSTLDKDFQNQLLETPGSLVDYEGKQYYFGMGDGCRITFDGGADGGSFTAEGATVYVIRVAGDQVKIDNVEGEIFGNGAIQPGLILTWKE